MPSALQSPCVTGASPMAEGEAYRMAKVLSWLKAGGDINDPRATASRHTLLMMACIENHAALLSELIKRGADLNDKGTGGKSALHLATIHGNNKCVESLLRAGAQANLRCAVDDTDYTDFDGMTALEIVESQLAASGPRPRLPDIARMLREAEELQKSR